MYMGKNGKGHEKKMYKLRIMKIVSTKDELKTALKQTDESIFIKGELATVMRKMQRMSLLVSVIFVAFVFIIMFFVGWSSKVGLTLRLVIHIAATIVLFVCIVLVLGNVQRRFKEIRF